MSTVSGSGVSILKALFRPKTIGRSPGFMGGTIWTLCVCPGGRKPKRGVLWGGFGFFLLGIFGEQVF
jgi:hypothetical protein